MRKYCLLGALIVVPAISLLGCTKGSDDAALFRATLSGANEVPARATGGTGAAGFQVEGTTVRYSIQVSGLTTQTITGCHIHSAAAGVNGPIRVFFFPLATTGTTTTQVEGVQFEGIFTSANVTGITYDQLLAEMRAGTAYVNVHTTNFPGGEIRGQVALVN